MNSIESRVLETKLIEWRKAQWFQGELKEVDDDAKYRLKKSMVINNFIMSFYVWQDEDDVIWILDGHYRRKCLDELTKDGFITINGEKVGVKIPDMLPATFIQCSSRQEAAKLVLLYTSQYAKITNSGLDAFMKIYDIKLDDINTEIDLPDFSFPRFEQKFNPVEIDDILDEIETNIPQNKIIVSRGDLFQLGTHKLLCGDCLDAKNWDILLEGEKARVVFTDPPYNLPADFIGNTERKIHDNFKVAGGEMSDIEFAQFLESVMSQMRAISVDGAIHYICMDFRHIWHMVEAGQRVYGTLSPKQLVVWKKDCGANGSFYRAMHELIFIYKSGDARHVSHLELKDRIRYNVWEYPGGNSLANPDWEMIKEHPTPKPVQMIVEAIRDVSNPNDIVLDFFLGTGSTLIAADYTGRVCMGTELEEKYCQVIIKRYIKHCKKEGKKILFKHLNGSLTTKDFLKEEVNHV